MKKAILILLALLLLTGCGKSLTEGTVIEKHYVEAHNYYYIQMIIVNKNAQFIPRWIHYSDRWYIVVQQDDKKDSWDVTEEYYNSVEVGDYVKREEGRK